MTAIMLIDEMPKTCHECQFDTGRECTAGCFLFYEVDEEQKQTERHEWCPLEEVGELPALWKKIYIPQFIGEEK